LKSTKTKQRSAGLKLGKVIDVDDENEDEEDDDDFVIVSDSESDSDDLANNLHELHYSADVGVGHDLLTTLSPRMQKSISLDTPLLDNKGWNAMFDSNSHSMDSCDEDTDSASMSLDILSEHEEDEKINENETSLPLHPRTHSIKNDDDIKVNDKKAEKKKSVYIKRKNKKSTKNTTNQNQKLELFEHMNPLMLVDSGSESGSERRSSVIIHKSDSDEIKVSEAAATVISEINESANGTVKSVFIKRKPKQPIKGKKKKRFLNKNKNKTKITKRQSTPNFHAAKSSKSTPMKKKKF